MQGFAQLVRRAALPSGVSADAALKLLAQAQVLRMQ